MKSITALFLFSLLQVIALAQPCPDSLYLTRQAQVDSFQILYPNCTEIEGNVKIGEIWGTDITDLSGLSALSSIGGDLFIFINQALTSLSGLENLTSIGGNLEIISNHALTDITGLDGLTSVVGDLAISYNVVLTSLAGLDGLTSIEGRLLILANDALTNLTGLDNIDANSISDLKIFGNNSLSTCEVESVCAYLANPNGIIEIYDNWFGCNSPVEIQDSCEANAVVVEERYILEECLASPNPFTTSTTLSFRLGKPENLKFTVYNLQSQIVYTMEERRNKGRQEIQWNAEGLPGGMYFYRIQTSDRIASGKLVVGGW